MPYTDRKVLPEDDPVNFPQFTEKDIENRGLAVGRRARLLTLRGIAFRHKLCIGFLSGLLCLVFLSYGFAHQAKSLHTNTMTAEIKHTAPSALAKQTEEDPEWTLTGYSDRHCKAESFHQNGTGPIICETKPFQIVTAEFDDQDLYDIIFFETLDCTLKETVNTAEAACLNVLDAKSFRINVKVDSDPDKCNGYRKMVYRSDRL